MGGANPRNPYKVGFGLRPRFLAGRRKEIKVIVNALDEIKGKAGVMEQSPDPVLALVGPRGVGKTVLLGLAAREATKRNIHVGVVNRELLSCPQDEIVKQVLPQGEIRKAVNKVKDIGGTVAGAGVSLGSHETQDSLKPALMEHLSNDPLLLVLDEAHRCEAGLLSMFFNIVQECMFADMPLAVIIAGTPGLVKHLRRSGTTYVERSMFLRFNTLSPEESKEALVVPARETGRPMEGGALQFLLDWSDNYPFLIQMVGRHTWDASEARGGAEITIEDAKAGVVEADLYRNEFYEERYEEIYDLDVIDHAVQIADQISMADSRFDRGRLATKLAFINDDMDESRALEIVDVLLERGYLWRNKGLIEPGIPSLFGFVKHKRSEA